MPPKQIATTVTEVGDTSSSTTTANGRCRSKISTWRVLIMVVALLLVLRTLTSIRISTSDIFTISLYATNATMTVSTTTSYNDIGHDDKDETVTTTLSRSHIANHSQLNRNDETADVNAKIYRHNNNNAKINNNNNNKNNVVTEDWLSNCTIRMVEQDELMNHKLLVPFQSGAGMWSRYVLGDCIQMCKQCHRPNRINNSFAKLYHAKRCQNDPNIQNRTRITWVGENLTMIDEIFNDVRQRRDPRFAVPPPDECVIHLRLGDVIELSNGTVSEMLIKGGDPAHHVSFKSSIKSYYEIYNDVVANDVKCTKLAFRGGSHIAKYYYKSRIYAHCLGEALQTAGFNVTMDLGTYDPDQDFYYMSHAKFFMMTTGGYGRLIGKMVKYKGGTRIGRTF